MRLFAIVLLTILSSCCPSNLDSVQHLQNSGSAPHKLLLYDPDSDTIAWIDTDTMKVIRKTEHWNHPDRR